MAFATPDLLLELYEGKCHQAQHFEEYIDELMQKIVWVLLRFKMYQECFMTAWDFASRTQYGRLFEQLL